MKIYPVFPAVTPKKSRWLSEGNLFDSLLSASSDGMRVMVHREIQKSMTDMALPAIMAKMEHRFSAMKEQNQQLAQTANMVMSQVQQTFERLRGDQMQTNDQLNIERKKAGYQNSHLHQITQEQLKTYDVLAEERRRMTFQQERLEQLFSQQNSQRAVIEQTHEETRHGFGVLEGVITNHEFRLSDGGKSFTTISRTRQ